MPTTTKNTMDNASNLHPSTTSPLKDAVIEHPTMISPLKDTIISHSPDTNNSEPMEWMPTFGNDMTPTLSNASLPGLEIDENTSTQFGNNINNLDSMKVNDRRLFYETCEGDITKYKYCVSLDSKIGPTVWYGLTAKQSPFQHYVVMKDEKNGQLTTIFLNHIMHNQLQTAFASFIQHGNATHLWTMDGITSISPLQISTMDDYLQVNVIRNPSKFILFSEKAILQWYDKKWEIERFGNYINKKTELVNYGESILTQFVNKSQNIAKEEFLELFTNPPNWVMTPNEIWTILTLKYMI